MPRRVADPPDDPTDAWSRDPVSPWIEQIQAGVDVELNFERLFRRFYPRLVRYFIRLGFDPRRSEEITQDIFLRVYQKIGSFERRSRFARWLYEIAHNLYANELRRLQAAKRDGFELPLQEEAGGDEDDAGKKAPQLEAAAPSPYDDARLHEETEALHRAMATLPPQQRRCVHLRFGQGLKYREVAEVMNVSIDTVKAHLGQAKARLLTLLQEGGRTWKDLADDDPARPES